MLAKLFGQADCPQRRSALPCTEWDRHPCVAGVLSLPLVSPRRARASQGKRLRGKTGPFLIAARRGAQHGFGLLRQQATSLLLARSAGLIRSESFVDVSRAPGKICPIVRPSDARRRDHGGLSRSWCRHLRALRRHPNRRCRIAQEGTTHRSREASTRSRWVLPAVPALKTKGRYSAL